MIARRSSSRIGSGSRIAATAALIVSLAVPARAPAQSILPVRGGASGAATGDGGGPFVGVAAPPQANLFTGTATTSITIEAPSGRGSMTPRLALVYTSTLGSSAYGYGWSVPIARVVRSTKDGVPRYDGSDTFVLETSGGATELEAVPGTSRYRARIEAKFLRIGFDAAANTWIVVDKSGTKLTFGASASTRLGPDATTAAGTYAWLLRRAEDVHGNRIDYAYLAAAPGVPASGLPSLIAYGGNEAEGLPHLFAVRFTWSDVAYPSAPRVSYRAGFERRQAHLLTSIETLSGASIVRRYNLSHDLDPSSGVAHLVGVSLDAFATDPSFDVALPSTVFSYAPAVQVGWPIGTPEQRRAHATEVDSPGPFREVGSSVRYDTFDVDGDALVDYVDARPAQPTVRLGTPEGGFAPPVAWPWPAILPRTLRDVLSNGTIDMNVFDIDGDGRPDLVDARPGACGNGAWCVYHNDGRGFDRSPSVWSAPRDYVRRGTASGDRVERDVVDLNGDGKPDFVDATSFTSSHPYWRVYWNRGDGFATAPVDFHSPDALILRMGTLAPRNFTYHGLFDMNGDGLPDFVDADVDDENVPRWASRDYWNVYFNTGSGFEALPRAWRVEGSSGIKLHNFIAESEGDQSASKTYTELVDLTGDGLPDRFRAWDVNNDPGNGIPYQPCAAMACSPTSQPAPACCSDAILFVNTGSSFSVPVRRPMWSPWELRDYSDAADPPDREFDLFDFDGDGLVDLVEREGGAWHVFRHPDSPLASGSATPDALRYRPSLLVAMMNGVGGETHLAYTPASLLGGNRLPFPYWTLTLRRLHDGITDTSAGTSRYFYRGGTFDGEQRDFRGFREVAEVEESGRTTVSEFHQDERLKGLIERVYALGTAECGSEVADDPLDPDDPCSPWNDVLRTDDDEWTTSGPVLLVARESTPFYTDVAIPELARRSEYEYDAYGNVTRETVSSPSATTVVTETSYLHLVKDDAASLPDLYVVGEPVATITHELDGTPLGEQRFSYLTGAAPGTLESAERCLHWSQDGCDRWSATRYAYDDVGNPVRIVGPSGRPTTVAYGADAIYARTTTNPEGYATETVRDLRNGRAVETTEPDGQRVETVYDGLGRPVLSWGDGFSATRPEISSSYVIGEPGLGPGRTRTLQYGAAPTVVFYDGLGREIATKTLAETDEATVTIVASLKTYDAAGHLIADAAPFEASNPLLDTLEATAADAPAATRYVYDEVGRLVEQRAPDGSRILVDASVPGVRTTVKPNLAGGSDPGTATVELLDGLGRVWRKDVCSQAPDAARPGACPAGALESRTEYRYDGLDRPLEIVAGGETANDATATTRIGYDGAGNRVLYESDDTGAWSYEYTRDGLLAEAVDPRGYRLKNAYDRIGRLRKQKARGFKTRYTYHRKSPGRGRVRRIKSKSGNAKVTKEFEYDERGRIASERWRIKAGGPTRRYRFRYAYDEADRRVSVTYPTSVVGERETLKTTYSSLGHVEALTAESATGDRAIVTDVDYDLVGNVTRIDYGNGLSDRYLHATASSGGRLSCLRTTRTLLGGTACDAAPVDLLRERIDARDAAGNVLAITDTLHGPLDPISQTRSYRYDSLGRLTYSAYATGAPEYFDYDRLGNLTLKDAQLFQYDPARPHLLVQRGNDAIDHDAAGNRTRKGDWTYTYDALGRLTRADRAGTPRVTSFYDEGQGRVARLDGETGRLHYDFGDRFEIEGDTLVRHYHLGGRIIASDRIPASSKMALGATVATASDESAAVAGAPAALPNASRAHPRGARDARSAREDDRASSWWREPAPTEAFGPAGSVVGEPPAWLVLGVFILIGLLLMPAVAPLTPRARIALVTAVAFFLTTSLVPTVRVLELGAQRAAADVVDTLVFYHVDHVGSPVLVSGAAGEVVEQRLYGAYGDIRAIYDGIGNPVTPITDVSFAGRHADEEAGLVYFGARFYDPELGAFLTPDPRAQFSNPYLYGGGNPVNGSDANGELWFLGFLIAFLKPILIAATVTAFISGIAAAFQGGDFVQAFADGFVGGAIGAGIGGVLGGLNVAFQYFAGGAQYIEAAEAARTAVAVAQRAAFTSTLSNAATTTASAAGLDSDLVTGLGVVVGLFGSYGYDKYVIKDSGALSDGAKSARELAKDEVEQVNTSIGHTNVTTEATTNTGWEAYSDGLVDANLAEDGDGTFWGNVKAVFTNQDHFGRLPTTHTAIEDGLSGAYETASADAKAAGIDVTTQSIRVMGATTHYVQDHLTLGHMVPGTHLFAGPIGAPIRFVIHQVFGGEVAFRNAQIRATRELLQHTGPLV